MNYIEPPDRPPARRPSFGPVLMGLSNAVSEIMAAHDANKQRQKQERAQQIADRIAGEDRLIRLAPMLSGLQPRAPVSPDFVGPTDEELGVPQKQAAPLLTSITGPGGRRIPAEIRGTREETQAALTARSAGRPARMYTLTQGVYDQLPAFYKELWKDKIGMEVPASELGSIGSTIVSSAEKRAAEAAKPKTLRARPTRNIGGRVKELQDDGETWKDIGSVGAPKTGGGPTAEKYVTVTDKAGNRVRITESAWNSAPPGTYTDIKPVQPRVSTVTSGQMAQARKSAAQVLGGPDGKDPDSLWSLAIKHTMPGPTSLVGGVARIAGIAGSAQQAIGIGPNVADLEIYNSQIEGFAPLFARSVGHTGVLTEKDIQHTARLFPRVTGLKADTREVSIRKLQRLERIMRGEEPVPAGLFEPQPGIWPPPEPSAAGAGGGGLTPEEDALLKDFGY